MSASSKKKTIPSNVYLVGAIACAANAVAHTQFLGGVYGPFNEVVFSILVGVVAGSALLIPGWVIFGSILWVAGYVSLMTFDIVNSRFTWVESGIDHAIVTVAIAGFLIIVSFAALLFRKK